MKSLRLTQLGSLSDVFDTSRKWHASPKQQTQAMPFLLATASQLRTTSPLVLVSYVPYWRTSGSTGVMEWWMDWYLAPGAKWETPSFGEVSVKVSKSELTNHGSYLAPLVAVACRCLIGWRICGDIKALEPLAAITKKPLPRLFTTASEHGSGNRGVATFDAYDAFLLRRTGVWWGNYPQNTEVVVTESGVHVTGQKAGQE